MRRAAASAFLFVLALITFSHAGTDWSRKGKPRCVREQPGTARAQVEWCDDDSELRMASAIPRALWHTQDKRDKRDKRGALCSSRMAAPLLPVRLAASAPRPDALASPSFLLDCSKRAPPPSALRVRLSNVRPARAAYMNQLDANGRAGAPRVRQLTPAAVAAAYRERVRASERAAVADGRYTGIGGVPAAELGDDGGACDALMACPECAAD